MKSQTEKQPEQKPVKSKREMVLWYGGIYSGGFMASLMFGIDLIRHTEHYMPSRSPTPLVLFSWIWMLVINPLFWFGAGCLLGWIMWKLQESVRERSGRRNG